MARLDEFISRFIRLGRRTRKVPDRRPSAAARRVSVRANLNDVQLLEPRLLLAGTATQVNYFPTWAGKIIKSTDPADIAYHPPSGHLFLADSEIDELSVFTGSNIFEISLKGNTVFREYASNNSEPTGITYNEFDGFFYITNDDSKLLCRYDNRLNTALACTKTTSAVSTAVDPEDVTADPVTGFLYVSDAGCGGKQVLVYNSNLQFQRRFSAPQPGDGEGIAFDPVSRHLFIVSRREPAMFEYTLDGVFLQTYDLGGLSPAPKIAGGAGFAPTSNPNDAPNALAIYIADRGVDNVADGGVYEVVIGGGGAPVNRAPVVNAGPDQTVTLPAAASLNGTVSDDGLPTNPGRVTTTWIEVSGPGTVTFASAASEDTTATFPVAGSYVLRLTANDGELSASDELTIVVNEPGGTGTTVEVRVAASSDDAEEDLSGSVKLSSGDLELVLDATDQTVGIRFNGVAIPRGATIDKAYLQFQVDEASAEATALTIQGQAIDSALTFTVSTGDVSSRARTTASTLWSPVAWSTVGQAGLEQRTPNIASVIQEIVNRQGWSSGNSLAIIFTGIGHRVAVSYDGDALAAPLLHVEYRTGSTAGNQAPLVNAGPDQTITLPASATLDGTVTDDGLPGPVTTTWSRVTGPGTVTFANAAAQDTTASFSQAGTYVLRLTADDGQLAGSDDVTITVATPGSLTTVDVRVSATSDDAEESPAGVVDLASSDLQLVANHGDQIVGVRFSSVAIPRGATIANAYVQWQTRKASSDVTSLVIRGQAADSALTFAGSTSNISSRPTTSASVSWSPPPWTTVDQAGPDQRTPNIASIIQEIVNRSGWVSGNSLVLRVSGSGKRVAWSFDGNAAGAPLLHVEYTTAVALNNVPGPQTTNEDTNLVFAGPNQISISDPNAGTNLLRVDLSVTNGTLTLSTIAGLTVTTGDGNTDASMGFSGTIGTINAALNGLLYSPTPQFNGPATLTITTTDPVNNSDTDAVAITVAAVNDAPSFAAGPNEQVREDAGAQSVAGWATAISQGPANEASQAVTFVVSNTNNALFAAQPAISPSGTLSFTPAANAHGVATVTVQLRDNGGTSNGGVDTTPPQTFTVTVSAVNDRPSFAKGQDQSVLAGAGPQSVTGWATSISAGPADESAQSLTFQVLSNTNPGLFVVDPAVNSDGTLTYTPADNANGSANITLALIDDGGTADGGVDTSPPATFVINVLSGNPGAVTTAESRVAASSDDAEERPSGSMRLTSSDLELVDDAGIQTVGMRFNAVQVPREATIVSAYVQFQVDEATSGAASLLIQGEDSDSALSFALSTGDLSSRIRTTSVVSWSPAGWLAVGDAGLDQRTPNLAPIIQQIVNRSGWASGNSLVIIITGSGARVAESYDGDSAAAPLLHVEYTTF